MSGRGRPTFMKRQKESARKRKQQDKSMRRTERSTERKEREPGEDTGEDPDIAGIVPGPQALPEEYGIVDDFRSPYDEDGNEIVDDDGEGDADTEKGEDQSTG